VDSGKRTQRVANDQSSPVVKKYQVGRLDWVPTLHPKGIPAAAAADNFVGIQLDRTVRALAAAPAGPIRVPVR